MLKVLNLYAGIGGNRKYWKNCEVTAVEKDVKIASEYKYHYPDDHVIVGNAHQLLRDTYYHYDVIWSSPPCQSHSKMAISGRNRKPRYPEMALYEEILFLRTYYEGQWIVENVRPYYDTLIKPVYFGRHAIWSNEPVTQKDNFIVPHFDGFIDSGTIEDSKKLQEWLGIELREPIYYEGNHDPCQVLRNAVHPDLGRYLFNFLEKMREAQTAMQFTSSDTSSSKKAPEWG